MGYVIGFTTGAYSIARGGGDEAAREFAGLDRKITAGVTAGANFIQIDMEQLGEWVAPELLTRIERAVKELGMDWAIHGEVITYYSHFDDARKTAWKLDHFRIHKHLDKMYEQFILGGKPELFPRYFLIHASAREVIGYYLYKEMPASDLTVPPVGMKIKTSMSDYKGRNINWDIFLNPKEQIPFYSYNENSKLKLFRWFKARPVFYMIKKLSLPGLVEQIFMERFLSRFLAIYFSNENLREEFSRKLDFFVKKYNPGLSPEEVNSRKNSILNDFNSYVNNIRKLEEIRSDNTISEEEKIRRIQEIDDQISLIQRRIVDNIHIVYDTVSEIYIKPANEDLALLLDPVFDGMYEYWKKDISGRVGEIAGIPFEDIAFAITVKFSELMQGTNDKLWEIFFDGKSLVQAIQPELEEMKQVVTLVNDIFDLTKGVILTPKLNALAASRYIIGHFESLPLDDYLMEMEKYVKQAAHLTEEQKKKLLEFSKLSIFEKIKKINDELAKIGRKFYFVFENPEGKPPIEGFNRISHIVDVYYLVKALNEYGKTIVSSDFDYVRACIDTDHLISQGLDPIAEIESLPDDAGKLFMVYHVGSPTGHHSHEPIDIGTDAQLMVYRLAYRLRQKGFGKDSNAYLIFERGGGQLPYQYMRTSVLALRKVVEYLEKNIPPEKLDENFFGWGESSPDFIRQRVIIKQHALDPLSGTIIVPEEKHTYLGKTVVEEKRKRPDEWSKEELK